jgi:hypothetical protein
MRRYGRNGGRVAGGQGRRSHDRPVAGARSQPGAAGASRWRGTWPVLQETDGQVHWPLGETVEPQSLPLPFGVATITCSPDQVALTFQVE